MNLSFRKPSQIVLAILSVAWGVFKLVSIHTVSANVAFIAPIIAIALGALLLASSISGKAKRLALMTKTVFWSYLTTYTLLFSFLPTVFPFSLSFLIGSIFLYTVEDRL